jgi:hypothetical protein
MEQGTLQIFDPLKTKLINVVSIAKTLKVTDNESRDNCLVVGKKINAAEKEAEALYKAATKGANDFIKQVRDYKNSLVAQTTDAKNWIKSELLRYENEMAKIRLAEMKKLEEERKRAEEERKALLAKDVTPVIGGGWDQVETPQEQLKKAQAEIDKAVQVSQFDAEKTAELKAKQKEIEATKVKGTTKVWNFKITNENEIPRDFLSVDSAKIRAFMKEVNLEEIGKTIHPIKGIEFYQETRMSLR